jgi:cardiolipin synthase A/B
MSWPIVLSAVVYLISWAICLLMLYVVPRRRDPESAGGWLLFSFFLPYLAALLFFLIGSPKLPRARRERQREIDQTLASLRQTLEGDPELAHIFSHTLEPRRQQVAALVERLGGMPVMHGDVELLSDYAATIDRIAADIDAAHSYVHLLYYIFADDASGRKVADALCRAAQRGVVCRVLYDGLGNSAYLGQLAARLQQAGIEARPVLPLKLFGAKRLRPDLRNHRKIAMIDGRIGYTGSQNITEATFKPGIVYEELVARVTGPIVAQLAAVFFADWLSETEVSIPPAERPDLQALAAAGSAPCQVLPSGPAYDTDNIALLFGTLLFAAQQRAVLTTPYFIPDAFVLRAIESAARRGVHVHLIVSEQGDQFLVSRAQRSYYEEMLDAGVTIHAVRKPAFIHAKHLSIDDDIAVIGSSNFDVRSFRLNLELVLLAYDERVVAAQRAVEADYLARANTIGLEDWVRRPRGQQFVENTCRLVSALL